MLIIMTLWTLNKYAQEKSKGRELRVFNQGTINTQEQSVRINSQMGKCREEILMLQRRDEEDTGGNIAN